MNPVPPDVDRWMLPGELARAAGPEAAASTAGPAQRTARDWAVDITFFLVAAGVAVAEFGTVVLDNAYGLPLWLRIVDPILGAALCASLWWRRRFPLALGIAACLVAAVSITATGAVLLLLFSLALHRGWIPAVPVAALTVALGVPYIVTYFPNTGQDPNIVIIFLVLLMGLLTTAGLAVRARRQLVLVLRLRADELRLEYERRLDDSRRTERERIAREMHDTLAHRISLLSVHAGALEYRTEQAENGSSPPLSSAEVHGAVGVMRANAHRAVDELREVLQVLRGYDGDGAGEGAEHPQPTADRLPELIDEARRQRTTGGRHARR